MTVFKTTEQILNNPWDSYSDLSAPKKYEWLESYKASFSDIEIWEQIYFQPGGIGVYAAWSPFVEIYIIVHNLFNCVEEYRSSDETKLRLADFDICLPESRIWVN